MRIALSLLTCLLLAGCPSENNSAAKPSPTPKPGAPATPAAAVTSTAPLKDVENFTGTWTTQDEQGQVFDIVIFPNGQAITNWTKGPEGARGERGFWRRDGQRLIAVYQDGWTDVLSVTEAGGQHQGFSPSTPLSSPATNQAPAQPVTDEGKTTFVGTWRLNKEPDGSYLYLALQSNGRALSTINGGTEGRWEVTDKGAVCTWPDGWVDLITRSPEGWQRRSWVGAESSAPTDLSEATRVGEARFSVEP